MKNTNKYRLVRGGHHTADGFVEQGGILELSPKQAQALVNKVQLVDEVQTPATEEDSTGEGTEPSREEVIAYLEANGIKFHPNTGTEKLIALAQDNQDPAE